MVPSLLIILLLPWIHVLADHDTCPASYSQPNFKLQGHLIETHSVKTSEQCTKKCASHADCHSINYYSSQGICELNNANHLTNPESLLYSADCQYIDFFSRPPLRCSNKLCSHTLECVIDNDNNNDNRKGYKCLSCKDAKNVLSFPRKSILDKVVYENPFDDLSAFTVSMWIQVDARKTCHTPFSYATKKEDNEIVISVDVNNYDSDEGVDINDKVIFYNFTSVFDGQWHHICVTWENLNGNYAVYIDGKTRKKGSTEKGHIIGRGALILGQEQDSYKGSFKESQSFQGNLTGVNMWKKVLTAPEVSVLASKCPSGEGDVIRWADFKNKLFGKVEWICSPFCFQ